MRAIFYHVDPAPTLNHRLPNFPSSTPPKFILYLHTPIHMSEAHHSHRITTPARSWRRTVADALALAKSAVELDKTNTDPSGALVAYTESVRRLRSIRARLERHGAHTEASRLATIVRLTFPLLHINICANSGIPVRRLYRADAPAVRGVRGTAAAVRVPIPSDFVWWRSSIFADSGVRNHYLCPTRVHGGS